MIPVLQIANRILHGDCLEVMRGIETNAVDLVVTSSPYEDARLYKPLEFTAAGQDWVDWMVPRVVEACRVCSGLVFLNMAGKRRDWKYSPVVEWLVTDLTRLHGIVCGPAPYVFYRVGIPGSGSKKYHRRDWEPIYAFARPENVPPLWTDNTIMGHIPKWAPGGEMSYRQRDGARRNKWGKSPQQVLGTSGNRNADGTRDALVRPGDDEPRPVRKKKWGDGGKFPETASGDIEHNNESPLADGEQAIADPGNVIQEHYTAQQVAAMLEDPGDVVHCIVGGGLMGDDLCHDNEAPFPERLAEFFIRSYCREGGVVLDPFCGSGTVCKIAQRWGRKYLGIDARESQVKLTRRRLNEHGVPLLEGQE